MTVRDAKNAARDWVLSRCEDIPHLVGALATGSVVHLSDDEPYPAGSDVDTYLFIDSPVPDIAMEPGHPLAPQKLLHRGALLDTLCKPASELRDLEGALANANAPTFVRATAIYDPAGEIARAQREVAASYTRQSRVKARIENAARSVAEAAKAAASPFGQVPGYSSELILRVMVFCLAVLPDAVQMPCVADLGRVTFRKAFVAARDLYAKHGATEVYHRLLEVLGSADLQPRDVEALLEECSTAFDRALRVVRTPFFGVYDIQEICRPLVLGGAWELVRTGFHEESMHFVATMRGWIQNAIENDGSEEDRRAARGGYERLLSSLGIASETDVTNKAEALRDLLPSLRALAGKVMAANPRIDRS